MDAALEFREVSYAYPGSPSGAPALERVSLRVEQGERLGVLGPNGGGKSTLLKIAMGLIDGYSGEALVFGRPPKRARRDGLIGYLPQRIEAETGFPISVRQAVRSGAVLRTRPWRSDSADVRARVERAMDLVGVTALADRPIGKLSGGQMQRAMIARAIAMAPRILALDEPMVGVDAVGQRRFAELLGTLHQELGLTVIIVSHDIRGIAAACDRVACLARTLHFHDSPGGLTPQILAEAFSHQVEGVFGAVHVDAHAASECAHEHHHHEHDSGAGAGAGVVVRTIDYLLGPESGLFWPGVLAGFAIAVQGALLSAFVVLKRMAFIGQGVSHAAFGGIGLAALLGLAPGAVTPMVAAFCVATAIAVAWGAGKRSTRADELIGLFLVGSMALGAIAATAHLRLHAGARTLPSWDAILFGSILSVSPLDASVAWAAAAASAAALFLARRPLVFWAYDEPAAEAFGAPVRGMQVLLLTLLAMAVVTAMKLAGVVLATALLVAPGAAALRLSDRLTGVFAWSILLATLGMAVGLAASFELDLPPGACVVGALIAIYALSCAVGAARGRGVGRG